MTALLPAIAISPFGMRFDCSSYNISGAADFYYTPTRCSSTPLNSPRRTRVTSPASSQITNSALHAIRKENSAPQSSQLSVISAPALTYPSTSILDTMDGAFHKHEPQSAPQSHRSTPPTKLSRGPTHLHKRHGSSYVRRQNVSTRGKKGNRSKTRNNTTRRTPVSMGTSGTSSIEPVVGNPKTYLRQLEPFPPFHIPELSTSPKTRRSPHKAEFPLSSTGKETTTDASAHAQNTRRHRPRLSDASSAFVHTVRTASTSGVSLSIMPMSPRMGRSSDSQTGLSRHLKQSMDSDRPLTTSSIDEAAFMRGLRRKQIIDELLSTEESYVADLKALVYLYSTLLASASSLPSSVRLAIQRNVTGILHLHETLQDRFRQSLLSAAARKWADASSPIRLGKAHRSRWRSADLHGGDRHDRVHRRIRSSIESAELKKTRARLGTADPADVLDIVTIFQQFTTAFFAYEEYCANHEIIAHELQKQTPTLWSTYESGMESLGRVLATIDQKSQQDKKGLTVADLLIKPIQRICKYPLLLQDLLRSTPIADAPAAHNALETVLQRMREIVLTINLATDDHLVRAQIQRRWLLQDRLNLESSGISANQFREFGQSHLCGVLYVTYQTVSRIDGCFALCVLFDHHLIIAVPGTDNGSFDILAVVSVFDLWLESAGDGKGMQCQSALHTWKLCFVAQNNIHEMLLSACSTVEEEQWLYGLEGGYRPDCGPEIPSMLPTRVFVDLKSIGIVFGPTVALSRQSSIQRAATVGNRANICQIILRNTHNPQDLQEYRNASPAAINRSQSHATTNKVVFLAPKRSDRVKLEISLSDIWTKERLPFPGMIGSKGSQILRASAGSLARKLSLASIHAPFSKRSASMTVASQKSYDRLVESRRGSGTPVYQIRIDSIEELMHNRAHRPKEWSELDTMDCVIGRMIGESSSSTNKVSTSSGEMLIRRNTKSKLGEADSRCPVGPEDSVTAFYGKYDSVVQSRQEATSYDEKNESMIKRQDGASGGDKKKRWSNPIAMLKGIKSDGFRNMLHTSK